MWGEKVGSTREVWRKGRQKLEEKRRRNIIKNITVMYNGSKGGSNRGMKGWKQRKGGREHKNQRKKEGDSGTERAGSR